MAIHDTHLYKEIHEQPDVLRRFLSSGMAPLHDLVEHIRRDKIRHILIAARGSSDNAGRYAQYLLGITNHMLVSLAAPSLFSIYRRPPDLGGMLVLGISQSGQSPDLVSVLEEANRQGAITAAITNHAYSAMGRTARHVIPLGAEQERSLAATKTYTAQLTALAALSGLLAEDGELITELNQAPAAIEAVLARREEIERIAERYRYMERCVIIGRGLNYATAFEMSLKLKELTYTASEPYSSADFLHGPIAMVERGFPVFVIAPYSAVLPELMDFFLKLRERQAEIIAVSDEDEVCNQADRVLPLPVKLGERISPIAAIIPGQLFAMHLADARGIDVDTPRGLSKVTETW